MYSELNEKLLQAKEGAARLNKIEAMRGRLESELTELEQEESELKVVLEKENLDVEKIESKSIASVFYSVMGRLDEHIEKERREAIAAKLKYDQAVKEREDIQGQLFALSAERADYVDCQKNYDRLYAQKQELLLRDNGETAQKLLELESTISSAKINLKEIEEALSVGNKALSSLNIALERLDSAEGWGTWDILGGGLLADIEKHSAIDDAKEAAEEAQMLLNRFRSELADVRIHSDIQIETGGFAKFADFFFDGLIADWCMQSKINESQSSVSNTKDQVAQVVDKLKGMRERENNTIRCLEERIKNTIVEA